MTNVFTGVRDRFLFMFKFIWYAPGIILNSGDSHLTDDNKAMALSRELRKS